ncbi:ATP synthase subunit O [Striga asiatica]|uniref:ATP synthase subunit O n=1 Tax=Striga asiatica TaxID=4170 RepID=A0A5A7QP06_STRAF|nr:ATP synthase subunit O [Striga asiatica]
MARLKYARLKGEERRSLRAFGIIGRPRSRKDPHSGQMECSTFWMDESEYGWYGFGLSGAFPLPQTAQHKVFQKELKRKEYAKKKSDADILAKEQEAELDVVMIPLLKRKSSDDGKKGDINSLKTRLITHRAQNPDRGRESFK